MVWSSSGRPQQPNSSRGNPGRCPSSREQWAWTWAASPQSGLFFFRRTLWHLFPVCYWKWSFIVDVPMKNCDFTIRKLLVYQRNQPVLVNEIWFCLTSQVWKMGHCQEKVRKCMGRLIWTDAQVSFFENRFIIFRLKLSFWTATYYTVGYIYSIIQLIYIPSIIRWLFLKPLVLSKLYATQYPNSYRLSQWYPYFGTQSIININTIPRLSPGPKSGLYQGSARALVPSAPKSFLGKFRRPVV